MTTHRYAAVLFLPVQEEEAFVKPSNAGCRGFVRASRGPDDIHSRKLAMLAVVQSFKIFASNSPAKLRASAATPHRRSTANLAGLGFRATARSELG